MVIDDSIIFYKYKGINKRGDNKLSGIIVANNEDHAITILKNREIYVTDIKKQSNFFVKFGKVNSIEVSLFFEGMGKMLGAGLGVLSCIDNLINEQFSTKITYFLYKLKQNIEKGQGLTESIESTDLFPKDIIEMIRVGEEAGKIIPVFENLKDFYLQKEEIKKAVIGAAAYPISILVISISVLLFLVPKMVEPMVDVYKKFKNLEMPRMTTALLEFTKVSSTVVPIILVVIVATIYYIIFSYKHSKNFKYKMDKFLLITPVFGLFIQKLRVYKFLMNFEILYNAGVPVETSLEMIAGSQSNEILKEEFLEMKNQVKNGFNLAYVVRQNKYIPDMTKSLISIGEETGKLSEQLRTVTSFAKKSFDAYTRNLKRIMSPMATIIIGGMIGIVVVSVYMPILSMMDALQQ